MTSALSVAAAPITEVSGTWHRHVAARWQQQALAGRRSDGRWGSAGGFPVLYLGQPRASVIVEAYRWYVDPVEDQSQVIPTVARVMVTVDVDVTDVLDLRTAGSRLTVGLSMEELRSATSDRSAYAACREVAQIAHQLGRHGLVAPAATGMGHTLALFIDRLPAAEQPRKSADDEVWSGLPPDPRTEQRPRLRLVGSGDDE